MEYFQIVLKPVIISFRSFLKTKSHGKGATYRLYDAFSH